MRVQSLVGEDPLEEGMAKLQYSYRKNLMNRRAWLNGLIFYQNVMILSFLSSSFF